MATLYLFDTDGSGPIACTGTVASGRCTWLGGGFFAVTSGSNINIYRLDGTVVTFIKSVANSTSGTVLGVAAIHDFDGIEKSFDTNNLFILDSLTS